MKGGQPWRENDERFILHRSSHAGCLDGLLVKYPHRPQMLSLTFNVRCASKTSSKWLLQLASKLHSKEKLQQLSSFVFASETFLKATECKTWLSSPTPPEWLGAGSYTAWTNMARWRPWWVPLSNCREKSTFHLAVRETTLYNIVSMNGSWTAYTTYKYIYIYIICL